MKKFELQNDHGITDKILKIPKNSFLATNLRCQTSRQLSKNMESCFIGYIPDSWNSEKEYTFAGKMENIFKKEAQGWATYIQERELQQIYGCGSSKSVDDDLVVNHIIRNLFTQNTVGRLSKVSFANDSHVDDLSLHDVFTKTIKSNVKFRKGNPNAPRPTEGMNDEVNRVDNDDIYGGNILLSEFPIQHDVTICDPLICRQKRTPEMKVPLPIFRTGNISNSSAHNTGIDMKSDRNLQLATPKPLEDFDTVLNHLDNKVPVKPNSSWHKNFDRKKNHPLSNYAKGKTDQKCNKVIFSEKLLMFTEISTYKVHSPKSINTGAKPTKSSQGKWKEYFVEITETPSSKEKMMYFHSGHPNWNYCRNIGLHQYCNISYLPFSINKNCTIKNISNDGLSMTVYRIIPCNPSNQNQFLKISYYLIMKTKFVLFNFLDAFSKGCRDPFNWKRFSICFPDIPLSLSPSHFIDEIDTQSSYYLARRNNQILVTEQDSGYRLIDHTLRTILYNLLRKKLADSDITFNEHLYGYGIHYRYDNYYEWDNEHIFDILLEKPNLKIPHTLFILPQNMLRRKSSSENHQLIEERPVNVEGFIWEIIPTNICQNPKVESIRTRARYIFIIGSIMFLLPEEHAIKPIRSKVDNAQRISKEFSDGTRQTLHLGNPLKLDNNDHISWLKPDLTLSEYFISDYNAYKYYSRKLSMVLSSPYCIDLLSLKEIYLGIGRNTEYSLKYIARLKRTIQKSSKGYSCPSRPLECVIVFEKENNEILEFLLPTPDIAQTWMKHISRIIQYYKTQSKTEIQEGWSKTMRNRRLENKNMLWELQDNDNNCLNMPNDHNTTNEMFRFPISSISDVVLFRGILFCKAKRHKHFRKCFVILVPNFLIFYKWMKTERGTLCQRSLKLRYQKVIPLKSSYVDSSNASISQSAKQNISGQDIETCTNNPFKAFHDGWKSNDERSTRIFTIHHIYPTWFNLEKYGCTNIARISTHPQMNKDIKVEVWHKINSTILCARSQHERNIWVSLISREIRRSVSDDAMISGNI